MSLAGGCGAIHDHSSAGSRRRARLKGENLFCRSDVRLTGGPSGALKELAIAEKTPTRKRDL